MADKSEEWPTPWDDWSIIYTVFLCENGGEGDCLGEGPYWDQFKDEPNVDDLCSAKAKKDGWICFYVDSTKDLKCYCPVCWAKIAEKRWTNCSSQ